jgi:hypothetical protein
MPTGHPPAVRRYFSELARVAWLVAVLPGSVPAQAAEWRAGAAKVCITPTELMWMSGYGARDRPAEGKLTELWAKALVLEDPAGQRAVLVTLDLVGIDRALSQAVCEELRARHGLERRQIALNCSHTHTGPVVGGNLAAMYFLDERQQQLVDANSARLREQMVEVVGQAIAGLGECRVAWGSGRCTLAVNRRTNKEADVPQLRAASQLAGPVDHDVPVLRISRPDGTLLAVTFGYACHATVLPFYQWSGDYPGFAMLQLEENHPGAVALFWQGCGGDQNPLPRRTNELAEAYGRRLADVVETVLAGDLRPVSGDLRTAYAELDLALDKLPTREQIELDAQSSDRYVANRARLLLAQLNAGQPLAQTYPYPVQAWRLGPEMLWVTLGGEVVVDYALRLKAELGADTWVAGYTNDVMAYIPSRRVLIEGGYEGAGAMVYYGLPTTWSPEVEETIVRGVRDAVGALEVPVQAVP